MSEYSRDNKKLVLLLIIVVSVIILIFCAVRLSLYSLRAYEDSLDNATLKKMIGDSSVTLTQDFETGRYKVSEDATVPVSPDEKQVLPKYRTLYDLNPDIVGWISIDGTNVDYPVMQTVYDEEYYLHRNYYKEETKSGLPFMDDRCITRLPSTNLIIYGHNMKSGAMFADLLKYESKSYYEKHKYIRFDTIYEEAMYEIIAVFKSNVSYVGENTFKFYNFIQADTPEEFETYYNTIRGMSLYDIEATAVNSDYLITLSTCEYSVEDGRFVVVARKISN
ncbi:MAG: class B sortase [Lachnospiraceae bacterium]|nr:class B sortase [Lachnospiraceae bacterium]